MTTLHEALDEQGWVRSTLHAMGVPLTARAGHRVYHQGGPAPRAYLVVSGLVQLSMYRGAPHHVVIGDAGPGEAVGCLAALEGISHTATATAVEDTLLVAIDGCRLRRAVDAEPAVREFVLHHIACYVGRIEERLAELACLPALSRTAGQILALSSQAEGPERVHITQHDLAVWVGSTRESTARALSDLRRRGAIRTGRGWIDICDRGLLDRVHTGS